MLVIEIGEAVEDEELALVDAGIADLHLLFDDLLIAQLVGVLIDAVVAVIVAEEVERVADIDLRETAGNGFGVLIDRAGAGTFSLRSCVGRLVCSNFSMRFSMEKARLWSLSLPMKAQRWSFSAASVSCLSLA